MKRKRVFLLVLIIVAFILGSVSIFGYILNKNKMDSYDVFALTLNSIYEGIADQYDDLSSAVEVNIKYDASKIDTTYEETFIKYIMGNQFDLNFKIDYDNKISFLDLTSSYDNGENINVKKYYEKEKIYTYISGNTEQYVWELKDKKDYDNIYDNLKLEQENIAFLRNLKDVILDKSNLKYFLKDLNVSQKTFGDKKYNVYSNLVIINKENYLEILKNINKIIKDNSDFKTNYKKTFGKDFDISKLSNYFKQNEIYIKMYSKQFYNTFLGIDITVIQGKRSKLIRIYKNDENYFFDLYFDNIEANGKFKTKGKTGDLEMIITSYGEDKNLKLSYSYKNIGSVEKEDVKNSISISDLSSDEYGKIYSNIMDREEFVNVNEVYNVYKVWRDPIYKPQTMSFIW